MPIRMQLLVSLLLATLSTCCASSVRHADEAFETGAYREAAVAYESQLKIEPAAKNRDHMLFQLALSYAAAEEPFRNLDTTRELLQELVLHYPASPYRPQALVILQLGEDVARQRNASVERTAMTEMITRDALHLFEELEMLREERQEQETRLGELATETETLRRDLDRLRQEVASRDAEIERLEQKLEELKRIDTQEIAGRLDP